MKSNNNNNNDDDDDDDHDDDDNNNNTAMGSVHARGDTFLTFGLKALTDTNTSRLATGLCTDKNSRRSSFYSDQDLSQQTLRFPHTHWLLVFI
jgi:hypothetical protein